MFKVIEKATKKEYLANKLVGGYEIYDGDTLYKKIKESTFVKNFDFLEEVTKEPKQKEATHEEITPEKRQKMIDKIKKVLKLAQDNPSLEEGLAAALQAQKLMAKYNIHEDEVTLEEIREEITSVFTHQKHNSHLMAWRKQLAVIISRNFRCKCYMNGQDVVFRGYTEDAKIARDVYLNLYEIGNTLGSKAYAEEFEKTGSGRGVYNSFIAGFLTGVQEGLDVQCTALMIITPKAVEEEFAEFTASFKKSKTTALHVTDAELFRKGKLEGKMATASRQIEKK